MLGLQTQMRTEVRQVEGMKEASQRYGIGSSSTFGEIRESMPSLKGTPATD